MISLFLAYTCLDKCVKNLSAVNLIKHNQTFLCVRFKYNDFSDVFPLSLYRVYTRILCKLFGSRTIAPVENCLLPLCLTLTLTGGNFPWGQLFRYQDNSIPLLSSVIVLTYTKKGPAVQWNLQNSKTFCFIHVLNFHKLISISFHDLQ